MNTDVINEFYSKPVLAEKYLSKPESSIYLWGIYSLQDVAYWKKGYGPT